VTRYGQRQLLGRHAKAVVAHADESDTTSFDVDFHASRARIEAVLDELLDDGGGPLDHLAGSDLVDELIGKDADHVPVGWRGPTPRARV